jgi:hypothetical protein
VPIPEQLTPKPNTIDMKRKELPEIIKGLEPLEANIKRIRTKPRKSLWDGFFESLQAGDSFEIEALEVNTVKAHAEKHGYELRHKKTEGNKVLAQLHKAAEA